MTKSTSEAKRKTALVTGASSGLGVAFAELLATRGYDLVITARRAENLESVAKRIRERFGVGVDVVVLDLSEPDAPAKLFAETEEKGRPIEVLINNAGGGTHQNFLDIPWDRTKRQIQLNVTSLVELTFLFGRAMRARGNGYVLNVASIGAYTPTPTYATYSAGKAFVRDFSEAIAYELRGTGVRVCSLCPGGTLTEFHKAAGHDLPPIFRATFMTAERCAAIGLAALFRGRRNIVSGIANALTMFLLRFLPRRMIVWSAARTMGEPKAPALTEAAGSRAAGS